MEAHENTNEKHNSFGHAILHAPPPKGILL
jgi:hypothetical protein